MKRACLMLVVVAVLAGLSGCCTPAGQCGTGLINGSCAMCPENCGSCGTGCGTTCGTACDTLDGVACANISGGPCRGRGGQAYATSIGVDPGFNPCPPTLGLGSGHGLCSRRNCFTPGPPSGSITYPYYTTRGPRDFLAANPRTIGP